MIAPKGEDEISEGGAAVRLVGPASSEQGVDCGRALLRFVEPNSGLQLVDHLAVFQPEKWLLSHGEDLPNTHTC